MVNSVIEIAKIFILEKTEIILCKIFNFNFLFIMFFTLLILSTNNNIMSIMIFNNFTKIQNLNFHQERHSHYWRTRPFLRLRKMIELCILAINNFYFIFHFYYIFSPISIYYWIKRREILVNDPHNRRVLSC